MGNSRVFVPPTDSSVDMRIRSHIYPASGVKARPAEIAARAKYSRRKGLRYPFAENHLNGIFQQHVHNCQVVGRDGEEEKIFMFFFKRHNKFKQNRSLNALVHPSGTVGTTSNLTIFSDVVVMRMGRNGQYINMRGGDARTADLLMVQTGFTRALVPHNTQLTTSS
ncbi:hypothetical protein HYPSUDRAFT_57200 [Hypholoma sublateritium FD-334 SS-4]|uniref:Uncharacterized protein n=1 Tax=Hypholoma sublateritium (strain FD-334 SS-4) TaxID=945553 RepID=A0A0D2PDR4_HYPSF|nr:hypothetical protein HYPSUDRAFT_57200 [Hypholoma sublateritium FD-334 SS-4]